MTSKLNHTMKKLFFISLAVLTYSCIAPKHSFTGAEGEVKLMTLDPGHFHAALVQKNMYNQVTPEVFVYAPEGDDVTMHLDRINGYNNRAENPTTWNENTYIGEDFYEKMIADKPGNVLVLAGNNQKKTDYIKGALQARLNVLCDKPMAIDETNFKKLLESFDIAKQNRVLLYDIMTERYEITNALQRELANMPEFFGTIEKGTAENPSIVKESIHHFAKLVSGAPLIRPEWYFDVTQQGEGIVDVTTHLVDLVQMCVIGEQPIDYNKQVKITSATRNATPISKEQYKFVTGKDNFADYLNKDVDNDTLKVYANGQIDYTLNDINVRLLVKWNYMAPEGGGDTHYAVIKGTKADIIIEQGAAQGYKPMLYAQAKGEDKAAFASNLKSAIEKLNAKYPGLSVVEAADKWQIVIPESYYVGHEAHFGQVTEKYLQYLIDGALPEWEIANMKAKYYTTTKALEIAKKNGQK